MLFGCLRQNINHNSEKLKVTEKLAKLVEQTGQDLKSSKNRLGMWIFVQYLKSHSWWEVLENLLWSLKSP